MIGRPVRGRAARALIASLSLAILTGGLLAPHPASAAESDGVVTAPPATSPGMTLWYDEPATD